MLLLILNSEERRLCVISTDVRDIQRLQEEFSQDVFSKKSGPNTWFDGSKITEVIFGTISSEDNQPYLHSLFNKIVESSGKSLNDGGFTLVYSSESKGFRVKIPKISNIIDVFEASLVTEDDDSDLDYSTKVSRQSFALTSNRNSILQITMNH